MSILFLLIPLSLAFATIALGFSLWAIRSGQYADLEGDQQRFLLDNEYRFGGEE